MTEPEPTPWPTELRLTEAGRTLVVSFDEAPPAALAAELLRVSSPSAEVQGHAPSERRTVAGKRRVAIRAVEPVGHYAVRLVFNDGHDTGIFTWRFLHDLGRTQEAVWAAYLGELAAKGLSRD